MTIKEYYDLITGSPGGLDYFYSWVKYYTQDKEHYKVNIVRNYFSKPKEERRSLNKLAEKIFIANAEVYKKDILPEINDHLIKRERLHKELEKNYLEIKQLAGGYYSFYGWTRENYPEFRSKGFSETTVRNSIYSSIENRYLDEYENFCNTFNGLVDTYLSKISKKGFVYESDVKNIPKEVITSFHQYFLFFSDYLQSINGLDINFQVLRTDTGLKFKVITQNENDINEIKHHLDEYILIAQKVIIKGEDLNEVIKKMDLLEISKLRLETELNHLKSTLRIVEFENKHLKDTSEYLKKLSLKLADKNPSITNQVITDGNQQFADSIENNK